MNRTLSLVLPALALAVPLVWSATARAGIEACGNIHVEADAQCEVKTGIECQGMCTPVSVQAQCAAELTVNCDGDCTLQADATCQADCSGTCVANCEAQPAEFDCEGSCYGDCSGSCDSYCASSSNQAQCRASCRGSCDGECSGKCEGTPASATCDAKCQASCSGSCEAEANFDCQVNCQADGFAQCQADLEGGCKINCDREQGALFCNGEFVDDGGNLQECVDALKALLNIEVSGYSHGECSGNMCEGEAGGAISCSCDETGPDKTAWLGALGVVFIVAATRRRRK